MRELNLNEIEAINGGLTYTYTVVRVPPQGPGTTYDIWDNGIKIDAA